jgi:NAD+ synthase
MQLLPQLDPQKETSRLTSFIKQTLNQAGFNRLVIATSGGIDSSLTLTLAAKAIGAHHIYALKLPHGHLHPQGSHHANLITKQLKIPSNHVFTVNIAPIVTATQKQLRLTGNNQSTKIRRGNLMARTRMMVLYDYAKKLKALVCGTENKSEHLLGYFTRFGDEASDLEPLRHLYKTQVFQIARALKVPQSIINQEPTAGLWPGQTDEKEFGFTYKMADQVLFLYFEKKMSPKQIAKKLLKTNQNNTEKHLLKITHKVLSRVHQTAFKHHLPYHL